MRVISFDSRICRDLKQTIQKEWLETNGLGAVVSSTVAGAHTRRSHALLTVAPQSDPYLLFSCLDETLFIDEVAYPLSTRLYERTAFPEGFRHLSEFHLTPFPSWLYKIGDVVLMKSVILIHGEGAVLIRYQLLGGNEVLTRLEVKPLIAVRERPSLQHRSPDFKPVLVLKPGQVRFSAGEKIPNLFFYHNAAIVDGSNAWFERVQYPADRSNGLDFEEDLYAPFCLNFTFLRGLEVFLCASEREQKDVHPELIISSEEERRRKFGKDGGRADGRLQLLFRSAGSFLIRESSVGAAALEYPWLCDSAHESLLAFHGLLLVTGKLDAARRLLVALGKQLKAGLLSGEDSLWFIHRVFEYLKYSEDFETTKSLFSALQTVVESCQKGSGHFSLAPDGLISADGLRKGKPVELQALWYNALCELALMAEQFGSSAFKTSCEVLAYRAKESFNRIFWVPTASEGYLFDCISEDKKDASFRPNQLLALGLPFPILDEKSGQWHSILSLTKKHLLTPYGLRSLAPDAPGYRGRLEGDFLRREGMVSQGSVRTWFFVLYVIAFLRANDYSKQAKEEMFAFLNPLWQRLEKECFGHLPEMFDGDAPHEARGTQISAQASGACLELYELLTDIGTSQKAIRTLTPR